MIIRMSFMHDDRMWIGSFPPQALQGIDPGDSVGISISSATGHVFRAKVLRKVAALTGERLPRTDNWLVLHTIVRLDVF